MAKGTFGTVINCMDGRTQLPLNQWMRKEFGVDYVDTITEPGPNGILARGEDTIVESIRKRVGISVNGHGSRIIVLVGHHDCAGNPGPRDMQEEHVMKGLETLIRWDLPVRVIGVWVGDDWKVEVLFDSDSN